MVRPRLRRGDPLAGPDRPAPLVGGDTLVGEDEVTAVAPEARELMKGDPLRGVHAFYGASAREWWAPLRLGARVTRRNALVGVLDKPSEFAGGRSTSGPARCSARRAGLCCRPSTGS